ncbi:MAG: glycosyltransferase family 2 protein [Albidovulum sp.]
MEPASRPYSRVVNVPAFAFRNPVAEVRPTVIVCDIEGGERGLFDRTDLSGVRAVVLEPHPKVYGPWGVARVAGVLAAKGLTLASDNGPDSPVQLFVRPALPGASKDTSPDTAPVSPASPHAGRSARHRPIADPQMRVASCMKDEGPFILEWLAWHRAAGVTDFVTFTNDCTDGTDRLLDRLDMLGRSHTRRTLLSSRARPRSGPSRSPSPNTWRRHAARISSSRWMWTISSRSAAAEIG